MKGSIAKFALLDSGFWLGLFDNRDPYHTAAVDLYEKTEDWYGLLPWPVLYEVVSTRFARDHRRLMLLSRESRTPGIRRIDDHIYRDQALEKTLDDPVTTRPTSLMDMVIRDMITDVNLRVDCLLTFNERDFDDVCRRRRIPIYPRDFE